MQDFTFTGLWPQTKGNPLAQFVMQGTSPADALIRRWATTLPDSVLSSPMRCEEDGHVYHMRLDDYGRREIKLVAVAKQGTAKTIEIDEI